MTKIHTFECPHCSPIKAKLSIEVSEDEIDNIIRDAIEDELRQRDRASRRSGFRIDGPVK